MKIAVLWPFDKAPMIWPRYRDGFRAAMEYLARENNQVDWYIGKDAVKTLEMSKNNMRPGYDAIIIWDDSNSKVVHSLRWTNSKLGLILTTDLGLNAENLRAYDVVYCEAKPVYDQVRANGIHAVHAFGTDTEFFSPLHAKCDLEVEYEAFYPATFSPWKRQDLFARKYGAKGLLLGTIQPDGWDIFNECVRFNTNTMIGYFPAEFLRQMYLISEKVHITGWEGSGRTVLEALSMGLPVVAAEDNYKCQSYLNEWLNSEQEPRDFILENYSEKIYARKILNGLS